MPNNDRYADNVDRNDIIVRQEDICNTIYCDFLIFVVSSSLVKHCWETLHKKWSFILKISLVNVSKSAGGCGFGHIYWWNP